MRMINLYDIPFGQRYVGYWGKKYANQMLVDNPKQIKEFVEERLSLYNLGISMTTYKNGLPHLLFLPFDFDSKNLKDAWKDAINIYKYITDNGYGAYLTFSGKKGFHVFLATKPKVYSKMQIKFIQTMFKNMFNAKTMDSNIFGDVRRLMRLPNTYNLNGGLCRILTYKDGNELDLDEICLKNNLIPKNEIGYNNDDYIAHDYPCVESLVREDIEPRHLVRFTYVVIRLSEGWSTDEILDEIESFGWVDFNEDYSRRQIEHIADRGYVAPSCRTLKQLGYCNIKDCEFDNNSEDTLKDLGIINKEK